MKKFMDYVRKHKVLVLFIVLLILLAVFCIKMVLVFTDSDETAIYGDRLNGDDKVEIDVDKCSEKVKSKIGQQAKNVSVRVQGRIIIISISVNDDISRDAAKDLANQAVGEFSDDERAYYDFQIYASKEGDTEDKAQFPIIGYRHHTKDSINWTKDR